MHSPVPWSVLFCSMALFLACLTQRAFTVEHGGSWPGWGVLVFGIMGLITLKPANLLWLCNPILLLAWFLSHELSVSFWLAALASPGAVSFVFFREVAVSEAGSQGYRIISVGLGYWLWLASCLTFVVYGAYQWH